ncbi:MAG: hypothetical protein DWQ30_02830 [Acidobacteria bacterium]|nr:MAG: hypothetical protein DWQ30_02830 [Acidobacteriota bacterium]
MMVRSVDSVTRTSRVGYGRRLRSALGGVVFGGLLLLGGCGTLFWNEGRSVKRYRVLKEGAGTVTSIDAASFSRSADGRLVHVVGEARTSETLRDETFGVEVQALALLRDVQMYQWVERSRTEERKQLGGSVEKVTTYEYEQEWRGDAVRSSAFQQPAGHQNPEFPLAASSQRAAVVEIGAYRLGDALAQQIGRAMMVPMGAEEAERARAALERPVAVDGGDLYAGEDPQRPRVGDLRIGFRMVPPTEVSVIGRQVDRTIDRHGTDSGSIALVEYGSVPADQMFQAAQRRNRGLAWLLRLAGFAALFVAFSLILAPLAVAADVVPMVGRFVGAGVGFAAFALAAGLSLVVIAVGWFAYRPLLSGVLLSLALAAVVLVLRRSKKKQRLRASEPVELPPLPTP